MYDGPCTIDKAKKQISRDLANYLFDNGYVKFAIGHEESNPQVVVMKAYINVLDEIK